MVDNKKKTVYVRNVSAPLWKRLANYCERNGLKMYFVVEAALGDYLKRKGA